MTRPTKSPMLSKGRAKRCEAILRSVMAPGERLIALADVTSVTPLSIGLAVTDQRLIAVPKTSAHTVEIQIHRAQFRGYRFERKLVFSYLLGITDAEEKNFGVGVSEVRKFLAPYLDQLLVPIPVAGHVPDEPASRVDPSLRDPAGQAPPPLQGISLIKRKAHPTDPCASQSTPGAPTTPVEPTIADELVKLADLHQRGLLTDAEFQTAKAAVISRRD